VETFPSNIVAGMFGFRRETMYDLGTDQRARAEETPKLNF
jgi:LemA protein